MLARECSLEDCSMQQDPQPKMPLIRALSGFSVRRNVQVKYSRPQMRPATDFIWCYKITYVNRSSRS